MSVQVIDTLKPKNNGSFPVVEAVDVAVEGYASLADAVTHFVTDTAIATITAALDDKADKTTTDSLQSQINAIITPVTQDAEVQNARISADGTSYTTLKERLDTENTAINEQISGLDDDVSLAIGYTDALYANQALEIETASGGLNGAIGDEIKITTTTGYVYTIVNCEEFEKYVLTVTQTTSANYPYYAFAVDNSNTIIALYGERSGTAADITFDAIIPSRATKLYVMSSRTGTLTVAIKKPAAQQEIAELTEEIVTLSSEIGTIRRKSDPIDLTTISHVGGCNGNIDEAITTTVTTAYSYAVVPVEYGKTYDVSTEGTDSATYPYYVYLTDENSIILSRYLPKQETGDTLSASITISNENVAYMYVLCRGQYIYNTATVATSKIIDLQTQIDNIAVPDELTEDLFSAGITEASEHSEEKLTFNFAFVTDTHSNGEFLNAARTELIEGLDSELSNSVYKRVLDSGMVSCGFHGGDIISAYNITKSEYETELSTQMDDYNCNMPVYFCKGNHECNHEDGWYEEADVISPSLYAFNTMQRYGDKVVINSSDPAGGYYYIDFEKYKIRCIVLNAYYDPDEYGVETEFGETQINWLYTVALDLSQKDSGWGVITFSHPAAVSSVVRRCIQAFVNKGTTITSGDYTFYFDTDANGTYIAHIHGHSHEDTYNGEYYNNIGVDRAYAAKNEREANRCCVDIFTITPSVIGDHSSGGTIYETRIGRGQSRSWSY